MQNTTVRVYCQNDSVTSANIHRWHANPFSNPGFCFCQLEECSLISINHADLQQELYWIARLKAGDYMMLHNKKNVRGLALQSLAYVRTLSRVLSRLFNVVVTSFLLFIEVILFLYFQNERRKQTRVSVLRGVQQKSSMKTEKILSVQLTS